MFALSPTGAALPVHVLAEEVFNDAGDLQFVLGIMGLSPEAIRRQVDAWVLQDLRRLGDSARLHPQPD